MIDANKMVWRLEYNPNIGMFHCELLSKPNGAEPKTFNWFTICKRIQDPEMSDFCNKMDNKYLLAGKKPSVETMQKEFDLFCTKQAKAKASDTNGSYIRIEIVDCLGSKKVIEVKPYFGNQQLTDIEFANAIRLLEEEKNKADYAFK